MQATIWALAIAIALCIPPAAGLLAALSNPVGKAVTLLEDIRARVEKEGKEDVEAYDKYACWCTTNKAAKTEAVAQAEKRITALDMFIQEAVATEAQLKTEIGGLEASIAEDQEALAKATALREKDAAEFEAAEKDAKEALAALKGAVEVLSKVQLLEQSKGRAADAQVQPLLLQLQSTFKGIGAKVGLFRGVMQRDLWDLMSSMGGEVGPSGLPVLGQLQAANAQPTGAAAGATSYSARSSSIFGMLSTMKEEFTKNLQADQREDLEALISYQRLRAGKVAEISSATAAKEEKEAALADLLQKVAQAKEDLETTTEALLADQEFLVGLGKNCQANDEEYTTRRKLRGEELAALSEAIALLSQDEARDTFGKALSFLQVGSARGGSARGRRAARADVANRAAGVVRRVARKHRSLMLASLAVSLRIDPFTRVIEAMDKMTAQLKAQQESEVQKKDLCVKEIHQTENTLMVKNTEKKDLETKKIELEGELAKLQEEISTLQQEVVDAQVALKRAGEAREAENRLFQQSVTDARAAVVALKQARDRLAQFYRESLSQVSRKVAHAAHQEPAAPGKPVGAPPPKLEAYSKDSGGGGVLQILEKVIQDVSEEEAELEKAEQLAQSGYGQLTKDTAASLRAKQAAIMDKTAISDKASAAKSETEGALLSTGEELTKLGETLEVMHQDCDYILKNFNARQTARSEELQAIAEAKAMLSGAS